MEDDSIEKYGGFSPCKICDSLDGDAAVFEYKENEDYEDVIICVKCLKRALKAIKE